MLLIGDWGYTCNLYRNGGGGGGGGGLLLYE